MTVSETRMGQPRYTKFMTLPVEEQTVEEPCFLPVELVDRPGAEDPAPALAANAASGHSAIEIDIAGGHRLRIIGGYDPEVLARLIRGLSA